MGDMLGALPKKFGAGLIAVLLVLIFAFLAGVVVFHAIPVANKEYVILLINILSANLGMVAGYLFRADEKVDSAPDK
jgi:uncharacterized membrane protein